MGFLSATLTEERARGMGCCKECGQPLTCETIIRRNLPTSRTGWVSREHITEVCARMGFAAPTIRRALAGLVRSGEIKTRERGFRRG